MAPSISDTNSHNPMENKQNKGQQNKGQRTPRFSTLDNFISGCKEEKSNNCLDTNSHKIIVVDIETTGLEPESDLILEIGICELNLDTGMRLKLFDKVVKEGRFSHSHRNSWIFLNSNLSYDDVFNSSDFGEYKQELQRIFTKYPATAYNKSFDFGFLKLRGINIPRELPCPMVTLTNIMKIPRWNDNYGYKYPSVQEAWDCFFPNEVYIEKHRAFDDSYHEALIVYEMQKRKLWNLIEN